MPVPVKYFWPKKQEAHVMWLHRQSAENVAVHPCSQTVELDHVARWDKGWAKLVALSPNRERDMDYQWIHPAGNNSHLSLDWCPTTLFSRAHLGQVSTCAHWFTGKWTCRDEEGNSSSELFPSSVRKTYAGSSRSLALSHSHLAPTNTAPQMSRRKGKEL